MNFKEYIDKHLNFNLHEEEIINENVSDDELVLLSAMNKGDKFYVNLNKDSDAIKELRKKGLIINNELTDEAKDMLMKRSTINRLKRIKEL